MYCHRQSGVGGDFRCHDQGHTHVIEDGEAGATSSTERKTSRVVVVRPCPGPNRKCVWPLNRERRVHRTLYVDGVSLLPIPKGVIATLNMLDISTK